MDKQDLLNTVRLPLELMPPLEIPQIVAPAIKHDVVCVDAGTLASFDPGKHLLPFELLAVDVCWGAMCSVEYVIGEGVAYEADWRAGGDTYHCVAYFCSFACLLGSLDVEHRKQ